ncbi:ADK domain-containing protein [Cephalotus follicularis]|uniref:adenylate kinase n=1 Tax=Cephalotus follicularis TaxID=3775 RepID=A0A1Q3B8X4_CEPFO|nr:ADK domain-containing protein [Cephalotus follicularis]
MAWLRSLAAAAPRLTRPCLAPLACSRGYGSAAAVELAYDYDDDYYLAAGMVDPEIGSAGSELRRGVHWVIIGDPRANKHVYAERLSKLLEVPHISMGSLVRQELNPRSSLYKKIANAVNEQKLVPEDVIFALLSKRLEEVYCRGETGFILDGVPRTRLQAEILDHVTDIDLVVNFKCSGGYLVKKKLGSESFAAPGDFCSMAKSGSTADGGSVWKEKSHVFTEQIKPLEDYYRKQKKLLDFQVAGAPGETWQGLLAALHLQYMNAVNSSQKLTA